MKPAIIHSEAREELDSAITYYEEHKAGLGLDFLSELEEAVDKMQQNPNLGGAYKVFGLRCYIIQRFPFLIFYTEFEELILVVAIAHGKRRPDYWRRQQLE